MIAQKRVHLHFFAIFAFLALVANGVRFSDESLKSYSFMTKQGLAIEYSIEDIGKRQLASLVEVEAAVKNEVPRVEKIKPVVPTIKIISKVEAKDIKKKFFKSKFESGTYYLYKVINKKPFYHGDQYELNGKIDIDVNQDLGLVDIILSGVSVNSEDGTEAFIMDLSGELQGDAVFMSDDREKTFSLKKASNGDIIINQISGQKSVDRFYFSKDDKKEEVNANFITSNFQASSANKQKKQKPENLEDTTYHF